MKFVYFIRNKSCATFINIKFSAIVDEAVESGLDHFEIHFML